MGILPKSNNDKGWSKNQENKAMKKFSGPESTLGNGQKLELTATYIKNPNNSIFKKIEFLP